ncbi:hypothetical protein K504DRAFT_507786 [Pleomassaria siparia CBS 279.74]|uniref:FAR-17a/AIG1-like protein n=1 Tax=Pleomassaria siparia CBS 279.74 TaxID=1314801 RepID=A0A6G1JTB7_9PLEO|nr:hypothetical protein K504DRAFT_507786 [Pleomassaria siparia CBS 279.74]
MPFWKKASSSHEEGFDPTYRYETSWLLSPGLLSAIRALLSLYAFTTIFFIFGWNGTHNLAEDSRQSFSYFTNLTYWGLAFYTAVSALHTCSYWRTGKPLLARWPRFLQIAHGAFYSTVVVYPWIVTAVYWGLIFSNGFPTKFATWSNASKHGSNSAYALFEIIFPRTAPLPFLYLVPIIIILALYLALAYLTFETEGFYVYDFLDTRTNSSGKVGAYIVGILVVAIVIFLIVRYLIMLRVWITEKKLGMGGKFSRHRRVTDDDEGKGIPMHNVTAE